MGGHLHSSKFHLKVPPPEQLKLPKNHIDQLCVSYLVILQMNIPSSALPFPCASPGSHVTSPGTHVASPGSQVSSEGRGVASEWFEISPGPESCPHASSAVEKLKSDSSAVGLSWWPHDIKKQMGYSSIHHFAQSVV
jgi:hypothetical protein